MIKELVTKNRSIRRYDNSKKISSAELASLVDVARLAANAGNRQRIRYATVTKVENLDRLRSSLGFAAYLKGWGGPTAEENPTGYVVLLTEDEDSNLYIDIGLAASALTLAAAEKGLGACLFRSFDKDKVSDILGVSGYQARLVISIGVPGERVELTSVAEGDIKYYRREDGTHVVPKYSLAEVLLTEK